MKTIQKIFILISFFIIWTIYNQASAYTPDFSNIEVSSTYSNTTEKLELRFELDDVYDKPSYPYFMKIKINDRTYTSNLIYSNSSEKLYSFFSVSIDREDVKSYYYMNYYVINDDNNSTKYSKLNYKVDIPLDNFLKWSNMKLTSSYNENYEQLKLVFSLPNIVKSPKDDYYMKLKIDNKNYESEMIYDTVWKKLYAFFDIDVDENNLKSYYYIDYSVVNDDKNSQVYSRNTYKLDSKTSDISTIKDKLTWSNMKITNTYNKDQEYLKLAFNLTNIKNKPKENYYVKIDMWSNSDSIYTSDLIYSAWEDKLSTIFYIDTPKQNLKSYYNIKYYVYTDKEAKAYTNSNYRLNISNYSNYNNYSNTYYYNNNNNYTYYNYDNFSWWNLEINNSYNYSNEELKIDLALNNINSTPRDDYQIKFYIDWKNYTKDLYYSSSSDKLYSTFYIDIDKEDIDSNYYVYYYIYNKDTKTTDYSSSSKYIYINNYISNYSNNYYYNNNSNNNYYDNNNNSNNNEYWNDSYTYAWDKINVIESNHYNNSDRRYYINQEIKYLENNRFYDSNFKDQAINIFEDRLDRY